jgi:hypothetical protein
MIAYQTDRDGVFVGTVDLDRDPLEQGKWLLPAGAFKDAPPAVADRQFARHDGAGWIVEDLPPEPAPPSPPTQAELDAAQKANLDSLNDKVMDRDLALKAFALIVLDEINAMRAKAGLPERTPGQLKAAHRAKLGAIS